VQKVLRRIKGIDTLRCAGGEPLIVELLVRLGDDALQMALSRLKNKISVYIWLQQQVRLCDVRGNAEFQKKFAGFYRVRRDRDWKEQYFDLMESSKLTGIDFPRALGEINARCKMLEASFASKLVATLDPSKPVIDEFVLEYFGLQLPRWGSAGRESKTIELYQALCDRYNTLMQTSEGKRMRDVFERRYPDVGISELKKLDLMLWQLRPE
jgi:hypothetical protein